MRSPAITPESERIATELHDVYIAAAVGLGWEIRPEVTRPYAELSEPAKELDRAFARWHLAALSTVRDAADALAAQTVILLGHCEDGWEFCGHVACRDAREALAAYRAVVAPASEPAAGEASE